MFLPIGGTFSSGLRKAEMPRADIEVRKSKTKEKAEWVDHDALIQAFLNLMEN
jgi:hypothetical protein